MNTVLSLQCVTKRIPTAPKGKICHHLIKHVLKYWTTIMTSYKKNVRIMEKLFSSCLKQITSPWGTFPLVVLKLHILIWDIQVIASNIQFIWIWLNFLYFNLYQTNKNEIASIISHAIHKWGNNVTWENCPSSAIHVYSIINHLIHVQKWFDAKNCIYVLHAMQDTTHISYTAAC